MTEARTAPAPEPARAAAGPDRVSEIRRLLGDALEAAPADAILLSGGLDTSILAALAISQTRRLRAFMVSVADAPAAPGAPPRDEAFAALMAQRCGFPLAVLRPSLRDLLDRMPEVVRVLSTFDPMELRNSVVTHLALGAARAAGARSVLTGDAADELFAGYSFLFNLPPAEIPPAIRHLDEIMRFSAVPMAAAIGIGAALPYTDCRIRSFALALEARDLVGERRGARYGKWILRLAYSGWLPEEILWRVKTPIEYGSGSTALAERAAAEVSAGEFERERHRIALDEGVRLRDREQYFYYRIYRRSFPPPRAGRGGARACPECLGPVSRADARYCAICGAYPIS